MLRAGLIATYVVGLVLVGTSGTYAGKYNEVLSIGDRAPAWKQLPDAISGKEYSLGDFDDADVLVVFFICNSCDIVKDYEDRILELAKVYGASANGKPTAEKGQTRRVQFVAINVNKVKEDLPPKMKERAEKKGYPFPFLFDETQEIAKKFGAVFTPEFFVLDKDRKVVYMGGLDDSSNPKEVKQQYLAPAIEAAINGKKPEIAETAAIGCRIRYVRQRR